MRKTIAILLIVSIALIATGCGDSVDTAPSNGGDPDKEYASANIPNGCEDSMPYYENGTAHNDGGMVCRQTIGGKECDVLYALNIVPKDTAVTHAGWENAKLRYVPAHVIKCDEDDE